VGLGVDEIRRDVLPVKQPAILRGLVRDWRSVREFEKSAESLVRYLRELDNGAPVDAVMTPPDAQGELAYNASMSGFNFHRNRLQLSEIAAQVLRYAQFDRPPAVAAQSALIRDCLPRFGDENSLPLLPDTILPRIWLGNRITTPTHVDEWNNLACAVAGRRRFTLFPPEQIENLYIGPLDFAPTGAAMSMVSLRCPDFVRYPKFREALGAAQTAELAAGDVIFIPPLWWHHVESLEPFNVLVNYWWHDTAGSSSNADSAFDALLHGMLAIRDLPTESRRAWAAFFEEYVFGAEAASIRHIPVERRGILGDLSEEQRVALRTHLARKLVL
jgi:Cupin-like domain